MPASSMGTWRSSLIADARAWPRRGDTSILRMREELNRILVHHTGQSMDKVERDTDRDFFMTAEQARDYKIVDEVISSKPTTRAVSEPAALAAAQTQK